MKMPFFTMKPQKAGFVKYILMSAIPTISVGILLTWHAAAWVFLLMATVLILPRCHSIVIFDHSLIEKALYGRDRFIRKVNVDQIACYHRNKLGEIILVDVQNKKLLCIESGMSNRDLFEQWLISHHIQTK